ncbi:D-amino acid dehydrogenase [Arthrobacter yangruifuii]|uniref:D-amino acid dehydrogenase n=1 Tax=Arthrobacter yangruifuii TaxID=2606616 RepID=UPI0011B370C2|nr:D-amino acid dehydrogenase [Arthrobacter yangruifuii]
MKLAIVGAGIIGVTSAYELARRGHEVTVIDREPGEARATSDSTAGLIAPGHSFAWASPSAPKELLKSLFSSDTSIRIKPRLDPELISWGLRFLAQCTPSRARSNTLAKLELAQRSQQLFNAIVTREKLCFEPSEGGILYLYRDDDALKHGFHRGTIMREHGQEQRMVPRDELSEIEPALRNSRVKFAGAIHDKTDSTGNPALFAAELRARCEGLGVKFVFETEIRTIRSDRKSVSALVARSEEFVADAYVLAGGPASARLARTAGVALPVYPARGYSLTVPVNPGASAPRLGGIDEKSLVAWSRFGDDLRLSATAEFAGYRTQYNPKDFSNILNVGDELFPGVLDFSQARYKVGLRPMTPDGPPIIGAGRETNLYYNTGHGHLGWTMACGSAELLADLIEGSAPQLSATKYRPGR